MQVSCFAVLIQFIVIKIVTAYSITSRISPSQIYSEPAQNINQNLLKTLLTSQYNEAKFPQKLEILTLALQQMPQKRNINSLADLLKQSALQSLKTATYVCKNNRIFSTELPDQIKVLKQFELPETKLPGQYEVLRKRELPASLPGQLDLQRQIDIRSAKLSGQFVLLGKNGMVLPVAASKNVLSDIPANYTPRTIRFRYY